MAENSIFCHSPCYHVEKVAHNDIVMVEKCPIMVEKCSKSIIICVTSTFRPSKTCYGFRYHNECFLNRFTQYQTKPFKIGKKWLFQNIGFVLNSTKNQRGLRQDEKFS